MTTRGRLAAAAVAALVLLAAGWWAQTAATPGMPVRTEVAASDPAAALHPWSALPPSAASTALLAQPGLRDALEALLHAAGDAASPDALRQRAAALAAQHFGPDAAAAAALAGRYVDYRVALGKLPAVSLDDPRALRRALAARDRVRGQHFSADEAHALFAETDALDQHTLARLEIARNPDFTPAQRQRGLDEAEAALPPALRAQRQASTAHLGIAAQTAELDARQAGGAERHAARSARWGAEAAERLATLDASERDWNARLDAYAQAAQALPSDGPDAAALRSRWFSEAEQARVEPALALRRLGVPHATSGG